MKNTYFCQLVKRKLKKKKLSLRMLAKEVGFDASYLSKVLKGKRNPPHDEKKLRKMSRVLDIETNTLFLSAGRIPKKFLIRKKISRIITFLEELKM